jgi:DNA modification methylase
MLINGNSIHIPLQDKSVHCVITSPPYFGLRDYQTARWEGGDPLCQHTVSTPDADNKAVFDDRVSRRHSHTHCLKCGALRIDNQIGLEDTPDEYVAKLVTVFREVWRVLRDDGTLWLNLGDSYARQAGDDSTKETDSGIKTGRTGKSDKLFKSGNNTPPIGLKPKDLIGIPWRVAFALQADGWYLRRDIIWHKENCMPESVDDRPTTSHEYMFLLSKKQRYFYDADAIREPLSSVTIERDKSPRGRRQNGGGSYDSMTGIPYTPELGDMTSNPQGRNRRSVWTIPTHPYSGAHFATFPTALVLPMVLAGTSEYGVCSACGSPWKRSVDRESRYEKREVAHAYNNTSTKVDSTGWQSPIITDNGFIPTCKCGAEIIQPIVLDPFCGSGTVGEVCRNTGRKFIGIDLSSTYLHELAAQRAEGKIFIKQEVNGELKTLVTEQRRLF